MPEKVEREGQYNDEEMNRRSKYLQKHSCYKVITADKNDEIIEFQASLIVGAAREVCVQEQQKTGWRGHLGILSADEC